MQHACSFIFPLVSSFFCNHGDGPPPHLHTVLFQLLPLPSNAQAKIEDMSRILLNHVSQMPMNTPMKQVKSFQATFLVLTTEKSSCFGVQAVQSGTIHVLSVSVCALCLASFIQLELSSYHVLVPQLAVIIARHLVQFFWLFFYFFFVFLILCQVFLQLVLLYCILSLSVQRFPSS